MSITTKIPISDQATLAAMQRQFVDDILPAVEKHAKFTFRFLTSGRDREDAIAETIALAWAWFRKLVARGKDVTKFPSAIATFAARHVKSGRFVHGTESSKDALSPTARRRRGFKVEHLNEHGFDGDVQWQEALIDNTQTPPPDGAAFRCDFPDWLEMLSDRDRRIAEDLALGHRTAWVAQKYGVSPARVSQLRRECHADWQNYHAQAA